jgi:hypothetical protein
MEKLLHGLLRDLERRCEVLRARLAAIPADDDVRDHALMAYQTVEQVRRDVLALLGDPAFGAPALLPNHLQRYRRLNEMARLVESYPLLFVERYAETDRRLTRLCRRLTEQIGWRLPQPLVGGFSSQYYWTMGAFGVICVPAAEESSLLGLPDLCHELGHIVLLHEERRFTDQFLGELTRYVAEEQRRVVADQRAPQYGVLYAHLFAQWRDQWLREFISDMIAVYLVGPAFGWQHIRLCAGGSRSAYRPALGEAEEHPADEARLRGVAAVLSRLGEEAASRQMGRLWDDYLRLSGERRPADYERCYPDALIQSLAAQTIENCRMLGLRGFDQIQNPSEGDIMRLIADAWQRFLAEPGAYLEWERQRLERLWHDLGFSV